VAPGGPPVSGHARGKERWEEGEVAGWAPAVRGGFTRVGGAGRAGRDDEGGPLRGARSAFRVAEGEREGEKRGSRRLTVGYDDELGGAAGGGWRVTTTTKARAVARGG
jgi:hypothetical protein